MLYRLLGPKLCAKLSGFLCCILCVLLLYYLVPIVLGNAITAPLTRGRRLQLECLTNPFSWSWSCILD
jgi:hypothetical protein